jgi:predicted Rossmann fold flavoprotein
MIRTSTLVIGGGASGIVAGIHAKQMGNPVIICDRMPCVGRKILASGNGRCNLLNENLNESFYNQSSQGLVKSVFSKFGKSSILDFFKGLGLGLYSEDGRFFPATNQSSSVLKVLEMELKRLKVPVELDFEAARILRSGGRFTVTSKNNKIIECERLILACGGKSYPALGSDGSAYQLAKKTGHHLIEPVPAAVPLIVKDPLCHVLQGQKISASARALIDGKEVCQSRGELLFTKYGLSGTAILDISEEISIAINRERKNNVFVLADLVPFMKERVLEGEISKRLVRRIPPEELTAGILPNKFGAAFKEHFHGRDAEDIVKALKTRPFRVIGTRGWNEADFTSGGIDASEIRQFTLESRLVKGLYFAGEILDVCGRRGGYNLAWAWASGFIAGETK